MAISASQNNQQRDASHTDPHTDCPNNYTVGVIFKVDQKNINEIYQLQILKGNSLIH